MVSKGEVWCWSGCASSSVIDRKSTRLNSSHDQISYAVFCLKKKKLANYLCGNTLNFKLSLFIRHKAALSSHALCRQRTSSQVLSNLVTLRDTRSLISHLNI